MYKFSIFKRLFLKNNFNKNEISYKNLNIINKFSNEQNKILYRRSNNINFKKQRLISISIKQARIISLFYFNKT
uniref:ribosomal protein S18 n=1 Tax=Pogoniopsis schenckii TaxID=1582014 RepID=UPI00223799DE|nr:ribosomal protein S18 [Pogoniopsis schenckii]UYP51004.1 ribosomal protein S18 [Pogoniopsis schenckii]